MKKMLRAVSLIVVIAMCMICVSGCDGEKSGEDSGLTQIRVWTGDTGSKLIFEKYIAEFNETTGKENGIEIVYEAKENLGQALTVALQTHQAPEIFMAGSVVEYSEQGYITPLDELPGGNELIEKRKDYLVEEKQTYKGKTYSIPFATTLYGLTYNKDMFKEAGIVDENGDAKPPKTLKELREYAKKLTDPKSGKYGMIMPLKWSGMFGTDLENLAIASNGVGSYNYTTGKYDFSCYKEPLQTILDMKKDGSFMPGSEGMDNDPARSRFAEGKIGMKFSASWDVGVLNEQFPAKCDWGVVPMPVADDGKSYYQNASSNTGYKISSDAVKTIGGEKIMIAYKFLVGDEFAKKLYESGACMPLDIEATEGVDESKLPKGWIDYTEILKKSAPMQIKMPYDISGEVSFDTDFCNNVWSGEKTLDSAISDANRITNSGVDKYFNLHTDLNKNDYIIPDYNREIK